MAWDYPEGGRFAVAVPGDEEIAPEVERFFGRELARYNHAVFYEHHPYIVFFFTDKSEAGKCIEHFKGEWFDPRDKGRASTGRNGIVAKLPSGIVVSMI